MTSFKMADEISRNIAAFRVLTKEHIKHFAGEKSAHPRILATGDIAV